MENDFTVGFDLLRECICWLEYVATKHPDSTTRNHAKNMLEKVKHYLKLHDESFEIHT